MLFLNCPSCFWLLLVLILTVFLFLPADRKPRMRNALFWTLVWHVPRKYTDFIVIYFTSSREVCVASSHCLLGAMDTFNVIWKDVHTFLHIFGGDIQPAFQIFKSKGPPRDVYAMFIMVLGSLWINTKIRCRKENIANTFILKKAKKRATGKTGTLLQSDESAQNHGEMQKKKTDPRFMVSEETKL